MKSLFFPVWVYRYGKKETRRDEKGTLNLHFGTRPRRQNTGTPRDKRLLPSRPPIFLVRSKYRKTSKRPGRDLKNSTLFSWGNKPTCLYESKNNMRFQSSSFRNNSYKPHTRNKIQFTLLQLMKIRLSKDLTKYENFLENMNRFFLDTPLHTHVSTFTSESPPIIQRVPLCRSIPAFTLGFTC